LDLFLVNEPGTLNLSQSLMDFIIYYFNVFAILSREDSYFLQFFSGLSERTVHPSDSSNSRPSVIFLEDDKFQGFDRPVVSSVYTYT
jgi:hypothetical protein